MMRPWWSCGWRTGKTCTEINRPYKRNARPETERSENAAQVLETPEPWRQQTRNRVMQPTTRRKASPATGPRLVSTSPDSRASNAARAALVVANVTPTGYRVGIFMANKARFATAIRHPTERG